MAITNADLRFFAAERMTDNSNGGGRMSATEIVSGVENSVFDDLSDVDRAAGDCSVRKIYLAVTSLDTAKYLDSGIAIFKAPSDPNVRVLATSTNSFYDERNDIRNYIESYVIGGSLHELILFSTQPAGSRLVTFYGRIEYSPPSINETLLLKEEENGVLLFEQYIRVVRILQNEIRTYALGEKIITKRVIACEISEQLRNSFHGAIPSESDLVVSAANVYRCVFNEVARYNGIKPFIQSASTGQLSIYTNGIYDQIVPTAQTETAILDSNAIGNSTAFVLSDSEQSLSLNYTFAPNIGIYLGSAIIPGSVRITVNGVANSLVDDEYGNLKAGTIAVAVIDYSQGIISFSAISPSYYGTKIVLFTPAMAIQRPMYSMGIPILSTNRYRAYVANLLPIPSKNSVIVDYMSQGNWYRLRANGSIITGASELYGTGTINETSGSVALSLGALPDIGSMIIFQYASGV